MTTGDSAAQQEPQATPRAPLTRDAAISTGLILPAGTEECKKKSWRKRFSGFGRAVGEAIGEAMDQR